MGAAQQSFLLEKRPPIILKGSDTMPHTADNGLNPVSQDGSHMVGAHGGGQGGGHAGPQFMGLGMAMDGPVVTKPGPTGTTFGGHAGAYPGIPPAAGPR